MQLQRVWRHLNLLLGAAALLAACGGAQPVAERMQFRREEADCMAGVVGACGALGHRYEGGQGVPSDPIKAVLLYEEGCRTGDQPTCGRLGRMLRLGLGVQRDEVRAADLLSVACRGGDLPACVQWGAMHELGQGVPQNFGLALRLYKGACDLKDPAGCSYLGSLFADGREVLEDLGKAAELFSFSCSSGYGPACTHLGNLFESGRGAPRDMSRAQALYDQGCRLGAGSGCLLLGLVHHKGLGTSISDSKALALFEQSCDLGHATGCSYAVRLLEGTAELPANPIQQHNFRLKGCLYGQGTLCHELADACAQDPKAGATGPCEGQQVWRWLLRGCASGHTFCCVKCGQVYEMGGKVMNHAVAPNRDFARRSYARACKLGDAMGCKLERALPLLDPPPTPKDPVQN